MNPFLAVAAASVAVAVGVVVCLRATPRVLGWLLIAHGVSYALLLTLDDQPSSGEVGQVIDQLTAGAWVFLILWLVVLAYLVPDGHAPSRFWRRWLQAGLVGVVAFLVGSAGDTQGFRDRHPGADLPLPWLPPLVSGLLGVVGLVAVVMLLVGSVLAARTRLRHSSGDTRLQLLWLVWGALSLPVAMALVWVGHFTLGDNRGVVDAALLLAGLGLPLAIGAAILRYRLFDIELVLSRTLTYTILIGLVLAIYTLLLYGTDTLLGNRTASGLLAVSIVAVGIHPTYAFLRRRIERWVYGYRTDPAAALRRLTADIESSDPLQLIETITGSVAAALRVDAVWVEAVGQPDRTDQHVVRVPLLHQAERIGDLAVEVPAGRSFSAADHALLRDLAHYTAVTVRAGQLAAELLSSRARIVTAREEERRRLRRDLHDGVGPSLAAIQLKLRVAQTRRTAAQRDEVLTEIGAETKAAIAEVRRIVDNLRPPAIDEVGLVAAIRQRAEAVTSGTLIVEVTGPDRLPTLPAAVEVAAFRIASEAVTNVSRHSDATRCIVELTLCDSLELTVSDNGRGIDRVNGSGLGWTSMRERAAEVGGTCTITNRAQGGVVVRAAIPLTDHGKRPVAVP